MNIPLLINRNKQYMLNLGSTFLTQAVAALYMLIITPILFQHLGVNDFALYGIVINLVNTAVIFDFGLNIGLLRKLILRKENSNQLISSVFFFYLVLCVVAIPVIFLLNKKVLTAYETTPICISIYIAILFTQNTIVQLFDNLIQTQNKIHIGKFIRSAKLAVEFMLVGLAAFLQQVTLVFWMLMLVNVAYIFTLYNYAKKEISFNISLNWWNAQILVAHIKYSAWYFTGSVATVMVFNMQLILMSFRVTSIEIATYLMLTRFYDIIRIGLTNFTQVLFPKIVHINSIENWHAIRTLFFNMFVRVLLLTIVAAGILYSIGAYFFLTWSKLNANTVMPAYLLLLVFILLVVLDNVAVVFLSALKMNKLPTIISLIQGMLGLILGYIWVKQEGILGVIKASLFAFVCTNLFFNTGYLLTQLQKKVNGYNDFRA